MCEGVEWISLLRTKSSDELNKSWKFSNQLQDPKTF